MSCSSNYDDENNNKENSRSIKIAKKLTFRGVGEWDKEFHIGPDWEEREEEEGEYPWELLKKDKKFKKLYLSALGKLKNIYWIRTITGPAPKSRKIYIDGKEYIFITFCKPHDCNDNFVVLLYNPEEEELFGYYITDGKKVKIGKFEKDKEKILKIALNELGFDNKLAVIERAKVVSADEIAPKKIATCPPIAKKLVLKPLKEKDLKIYQIILQSTKKDYEISEDTLENIKPRDIYVAFADVNDDGKVDIIYSIGHTLFCGSAGCSTTLLVNKGDSKYKSLSLGLSLDDTIYITTEKKKGFRTLITDGHIKLIYNGKAYQAGGECYAKQLQR
jgi:hypothetical protein